MKQIPFTLEAFGPDGMLKEGYEWRDHEDVPVHFVRYYLFVGRIAFVTHLGEFLTVTPKFCDRFKLYRRTRTAEEVARELAGWRNYHPSSQQDIIKAVQAGMDEMKND